MITCLLTIYHNRRNKHGQQQLGNEEEEAHQTHQIEQPTL